MARVEPLDVSECEGLGLERAFAASEKAVGFVTNNLRIMARKPEVVKALMTLYGAAFMAPGSVPLKLKILAGFMASASAGCMYCIAHTGGNVLKQGYSQEKLQAIWDYETSDLFDEAERAVLKVAQGSGQTPNAVSDEDFDVLKQHFNDEQIVELVTAISVYGFFNRFNDTLATPIEGPTAEFAESVLGPIGWQVGKHK